MKTLLHQQPAQPRELTNASQASTKRLTTLYIMALGTIALIATAGQFLVQHILSHQSRDAAMISAAEQQRTHSQQLSKTILALRLTTDETQRKQYLEKLPQILAAWQTSYSTWEQKDRELHPKGYSNSQQLLSQVNSSYTEIKRIAVAVLEHNKEHSQSFSRNAFGNLAPPGYIPAILTQESRFVAGMDQIIAQYQRESGSATQTLRGIEFGLFGLTILVLGLEAMWVFRPAVQKIQQTVAALSEEKEKSERLLLNILPAAIADRLKQDETNIADNFAEVTVLFGDIVGFTQLSSTIPPRELVILLNQLFSGFDHLVEKYHLEKIKTIGDAYMVVGGLPVQRPDHAEAMADLALDMLQFLSDFNAEHQYTLGIRIGINTGPVVAGVIGTKKFIYDLWGDTVNVASRMESHGLPNQIHVTDSTYACLHYRYQFTEREPIEVKGKGKMQTYFLEGRKASA